MRALSVQGGSSGAGGCRPAPAPERILRPRGSDVVPFEAWRMPNHACVVAAAVEPCLELSSRLAGVGR